MCNLESHFFSKGAHLSAHLFSIKDSSKKHFSSFCFPNECFHTDQLCSSCSRCPDIHLHFLIFKDKRSDWKWAKGFLGHEGQQEASSSSTSNGISAFVQLF